MTLDPSKRIAAWLFATAFTITVVGSTHPILAQTIQPLLTLASNAPHPSDHKTVPPPAFTQGAVIAMAATPTPTPTPEPTAEPTPEPTPIPTVVYTAPAPTPVYVAPTTAPVPVSGSSDEVQATIVYWANHYGVDPNWMLGVAKCESGFSPAAINHGYYAGGGNPSGIFQFLPETFYGNAAKIGLVAANLWDYHHQAQVAAWMFSVGQSGQWECK